MMHSRGFVLSENQAFAGQTRTPGPSRLLSSPMRKNMTTGKRALGQSSNPFGPDLGSAGPKQLFQDLMSSKSPVKALGDRNMAKTPGPSKSDLGKQDASRRKGKGASGSNTESSPIKKGSSELSPRKATTSNALRSINGKRRQTSELPFTKPGQSSTNDAAGNMMKTPAPKQLGKARGTGRQNSFVTPAANIGRAGQIKARMGEILDAEMGLSLQKGETVTEQVAEQPTVQMTEEEMYPEIEYMPPSFHAQHPVFEFPDELDDLPRGKELGAQLSAFTTRGLRAAGPDDLSDIEVSPMEAEDGDSIVPPRPAGESDDDDPWPDVPVPNEVSDAQQPPSSRPAAVSRPATSTATRSLASSRASTIAKKQPTLTGVRPPVTGVAASIKRPAGSTRSNPAAVGAAANARAVTTRAPGQPPARSTGLQRSFAAAPGSRAVASGASTVSRPTLAVRSSAIPVRSCIRPAAPTTKAAATRAGTQQSAKAAQQSQTQKPTAMALNPKLIDFVDDELGKQTAATLDRLDAEEDVTSLQLDLEYLSDQDA